MESNTNNTDNNYDSCFFKPQEIFQDEKFFNKQLPLIRNVPHIEGNFACLIYFKIPKILGEKFSNYSSKVESFLHGISVNLNQNRKEEKDGLNIFNKLSSSEYHVSLSPTFYLKYHQINTFINKIKDQLKIFKNGIKLILTDKLKVFTNEYNTVCFICLDITKNKQFNKIYTSIYETLVDFGFGDILR
jgi:hypothetical protein